mmetsp:Transcript_111195/g.321445  ORF Transcript_111195/g.321445 Transcript_111195/m.321445 type:complete len:209 (-) Transcript_111195:318-944(-)
MCGGSWCRWVPRKSACMSSGRGAGASPTCRSWASPKSAGSRSCRRALVRPMVRRPGCRRASRGVPPRRRRSGRRARASRPRMSRRGWLASGSGPSCCMWRTGAPPHRRPGACTARIRMRRSRSLGARVCGVLLWLWGSVTMRSSSGAPMAGSKWTKRFASPASCSGGRSHPRHATPRSLQFRTGTCKRILQASARSAAQHSQSRRPYP